MFNHSRDRRLFSGGEVQPSGEGGYGEGLQMCTGEGTLVGKTPQRMQQTGRLRQRPSDRRTDQGAERGQID